MIVRTPFLPLKSVSNSWADTTIYDVTGRPVATLSIESEATEFNQVQLEADMAYRAVYIVNACNAHDDLVKALMAIVDADDAQELTNAHINLGHAALKKAGY